MRVGITMPMLKINTGCDDHSYNLYYCHDFPIADLDHYHRQPDKALKEFVDDITAHIAKFGLRNPIGVQVNRGMCTVRPGKCRVSAYRALGHDTIPALITDFDQLLKAIPEGWISLPYDQQYIQDKYFSGDSIVELSLRRFCIKKNATKIHSPGVENEFARELRESDL